MHGMHGTVLGLAIAMGGYACSAQEITIPFQQIERDAQLSARLTVLGDESASSPSASRPSSSSLAPGVTPPDPFVSSFSRVPPVTVGRSIGSRFYLLNGLHLGMAVFDVEMTHRCIVSHKCREGNPLMPSSLAGALSVNFAFVGYGSWISYRLKKHHARVWWLSPAIGTASHIVGAATGLMHE